MIISGYRTFLKKLPKDSRVLVAMEASGGYEKKASRWLIEQGFSVAIVNAKRGRDYARASGQLAKTDIIDARVIRQFAQTFNPKPQLLQSHEVEYLEMLTKRRAQIVRLITSRNSIGNPPLN